MAWRLELYELVPMVAFFFHSSTYFFFSLFFGSAALSSLEPGGALLPHGEDRISVVYVNHGACIVQ